jgi:hypothetical protein
MHELKEGAYSPYFVVCHPHSLFFLLSFTAQYPHIHQLSPFYFAPGPPYLADLPSSTPPPGACVRCRHPHLPCHHSSFYPHTLRQRAWHPHTAWTPSPSRRCTRPSAARNDHPRPRPPASHPHHPRPERQLPARHATDSRSTNASTSCLPLVVGCGDVHGSGRAHATQRMTVNG